MEVFVIGVALGMFGGASATLASLYLTLRVRVVAGEATEAS